MNENLLSLLFQRNYLNCACAELHQQKRARKLCSATLKSTKMFTIWCITLLAWERHNFQFVVRAIIPELQNNLTSKCNAHKLLFPFLPNFCYWTVAEIWIFFCIWNSWQAVWSCMLNNFDCWISLSYCLQQVHWSVPMLTSAKCSNNKLHFGTKINWIY